MESLPGRTHVRLWIRAHGTYLYAMRQRRASSPDAVRAAHRQHRLVRGGASCVALHAAAPGRYLTNVLEEAPPGQGARSAVQRAYDAHAAEQDDAPGDAMGAEDGSGDVLMRRRAYGWWSNFGNPTALMSWALEGVSPRQDAPHGQGARRAVQRVHDPPERGDLLWEDESGEVLMRHRTYGARRNFDNQSTMMRSIPPREDAPELSHVTPQWDRIGRRRRGRRRRASESRNSQVENGGEQGQGEGEEDHPMAAPQAFSWKSVLGYPMAQTVPGTCALVAATKCLEAQHRKEFEAIHGARTFPCQAAAPRKLRAKCFREVVWNPSTREYRRTWEPKEGSQLKMVLSNLLQLGGARTTNAPPPAPFFLPLTDWEVYHHDDGLTPEIAAQLLHRRGPCVGTLFATAEFYRTFITDSSDKDKAPAPVVFRGCPREKREEVMDEDPDEGMHAVVCYAYDHDNKGKLIISVLDNQWPTGPSRVVDFGEFDSLYVLFVRPLPSHHLLGRSLPPVYPLSGWM